MFDLLKGVRIVDLSTIVLGPYATQLLGDFGADVIKVEPPAGDLFRTARPGRPGGDGAGFLNVNRNKRSIVLDLTRDDDRATLLRLVTTADVFVHNMRPRAVARLGFDYDAVRAVRPDIVYCAARGFGAGLQGDEPAYDDCIQAASGLAWLNAGPSGEPHYVPSVLADKIGGLHLALAIAAGVASRALTGEGLFVEAPMHEAMVSFLLPEHLGGMTFDPPIGPMGYDRLTSPDRRPFRTADGYLTIMPYTLAHWQRYLRMIGNDALADDPRVVESEQRSHHVDMLYGIIAAESPARTNAEWIALLRDADIPHAPVNRMEDLLDDPHLTSAGMFRWLDHPREGRIRSMRPPFAVQGRDELPDRPAPRLGADREAILAEIPAAGR
ncbi:MAG TPA: CoA transferase [Sphingomonas sp.]|nr:CoA transferase [Sphingomonas sp.]